MFLSALLIPRQLRSAGYNREADINKLMDEPYESIPKPKTSMKSDDTPEQQFRYKIIEWVDNEI